MKVRGTSNGDECVTLVLNARVEVAPEVLERTVREIFSSIVREEKLEMNIVAWNCIQPGRPDPTHRYKYIV